MATDSLKFFMWQLQQWKQPSPSWPSSASDGQKQYRSAYTRVTHRTPICTRWSATSTTTAARSFRARPTLRRLSSALPVSASATTYRCATGTTTPNASHLAACRRPQQHRHRGQRLPLGRHEIRKQQQEGRLRQRKQPPPLHRFQVWHLCVCLSVYLCLSVCLGFGKILWAVAGTEFCHSRAANK